MVDNYQYEQLFHTALIAVVKPPTATNNLTPAPIPTSTCIDTAPEDCETVKQIDVKLLRMWEQWAQSRSGPFLESVLNTIAYLRSELEQQAPPSAPGHSLNSSPIATFELDTATPAQTTSQASTTTTDLSTAASTETMTVAMVATVELHDTTQDDSEEKEGSESMRREEISEEKNGEEEQEKRAEERERRAEEQEKGREREVQREEEDTEEERIKENQDDV